MPVFLSSRQPNLVEFMDREDCDPVLLENTYRQFETINRLLSGWKKIYRNEIRPLLQKDQPNTLLDIGFGGGDVSVRLAKWAEKDGFDLQITAIEKDDRALEFVNENRDHPQVQFNHISSTELLEQVKTYDFVISNHVLHHLDSPQTKQLLSEAKQLSKKKVVFSDIERSDVGYFLFSSFTPFLFRKSFIVKDGLLSIKRSYTRSELESVVPSQWKVKRQFPFRLLLIHEK